MLHQGVEGVFGVALRVIGVSLPQLVEGENMELLGQPRQIEAPRIESTLAKRSAVEQDEWLTPAILVVPGADAIDVDELDLARVEGVRPCRARQSHRC